MCCPWSDVRLNPSRAAAAEQMEGDQPPGDPQGRLHREWPRAQELLIQRGERIEPSPSFLPPAASPDWHRMSPESLAGITPCPLPAPRGSSRLVGTAQIPPGATLGTQPFLLGRWLGMQCRGSVQPLALQSPPSTALAPSAQPAQGKLLAL